MPLKVYLDSEFIGLHKNSQLISIGLIDENSNTFYAELNDFDRSDLDDWIRANVLSNLMFKNHDTLLNRDEYGIMLKADSETIKLALEEWFQVLLRDSGYDRIEIWSDCLSYDWVLFCDLWGNALSLPAYVYYIPFDICTRFKEYGVDPDISREKFCGIDNTTKHNALWDAMIIKKCNEQLDTIRRGLTNGVEPV